MTDGGFDETEKVVVEPGPDDQGQRIDLFLSEKLPDVSRTRIQRLIEDGHVRSGEGAITKTNTRLSGIEWIELDLPPPEPSSLEPENLPITILHQDSDLAVVVKPPGIPTHPTAVRTTGTLVNALLFHLDDLSGIGGVLRPGIVHRLDRVTSGILVIAKNPKAHEHLSDQFRERKVEKTYRALCLGRDPGAEGQIEGRIRRHTAKRRRMSLGQEGRDSLTGYKRLAVEHPLYGMMLHPKTGRTHQIRVHLESIHLSVALDDLYGYEPKRWPKPELNNLLKGYPGIFLHAGGLAFEHPSTGQRVSFEANPPEVFQEVWDKVFAGQD